jgi:hypothetical protein
MWPDRAGALRAESRSIMIRTRNVACAAVVACAVVVATLLFGASAARAQSHDSFHNMPITTTRPLNDKRVKRVGERMAAEMLARMQRFKGAPRDSAMLLLARQTQYHMIVLSQCDFELHFSRQNASPAWQALADSIARDTRRIVLRGERLTNGQINDVLNRAARMAQFCMNARSDW